MLVTLLVSNLETSRVVRLMQPENMSLMFVTLLVFQLEPKSMVVRLIQLANMLCMFVTWLVSHLETSRVARLSQLKNM